jgi:hypothetical protein
MTALPPLSPDEILTAEYEYLSATAFQANEDRARVASFYLVTFGSFIAALVSAQLEVTPDQLTWVQWGFSGLFLALALMALSTILQLARLRVAWFESVQALNAIKEYYIARHPDLKQAIKWRSISNFMPARFKLNSVGFLLVLQVALLGGASLGAALFFGLLAQSGGLLFLPALASGWGFFFILLIAYRWALN